jgi:acyl-CoA dehydrogenase
MNTPMPGMDADVVAAFIDPFQRSLRGRVANRCVQSHGGAGYLADYKAERFYRDVRIYRIYEGTTQILQLQIAKHMLRDYAPGA